ncbi:MAG: acyltransferase [Verrucomicrobiota bacterium]
MNSLVILMGGALMMCAVIATAAGIARNSKFYRQELTESGSRELALDGLRGMAALMVMAHHAALSNTWLTTGEWGDARNPILQLFGPMGVIIFFMLTGYLFWGKARVANGKMNIVKLWRGRLLRIAPLYMFSLLVILLVATTQTDTGWLALENWKSLLRLLALGALNWHKVGQMDFTVYNAGVTWTLHYEWAFYLMLPFIAWLAPGRKVFGLAVIAYLLVWVGLWYNLNLQGGLYFILGMLCPVLLENPSLRSQFRHPVAACLALSATILLCVLFGSDSFVKGHSASIAGAVFPLLFVAAAGNQFLNILTHPAMRCLGAISFSLYLLHGIVFRLVIHILKVNGLTSLTQLDHWLILIITAIATTLLCAATYRWIEFPFLSISHKKCLQAAGPATETIPN